MFAAPKLTRAEAAAGNALCRLAAVAAREFDTEIVFGAAVSDEESVELTVAINGAETRLFVPPGAMHRAARSFFGRQGIMRCRRAWSARRSRPPWRR